MVVTKKAIESEHCKNKIETLLIKLDIKYKNIGDYILAFIHKSIVNEKPDFAPTHNERLEFLWDAVLELVITDSLYIQFPNKQEWELTDLRSAIVRGRNLASVSKQLWLEKYLFLWKGEELSWWRNNDYILANTLEAFLWAMYLDIWYKWSSDFIIKYIYNSLDSILENELFKDYKTQIQEYTQAEFDITPTYKVINETWPDHDKNFEVWVYLKEELIWKWVWSSKKKAQEKAAKDGLIIYKIIK